MTLQELNQLPPAEAARLFQSCCGSRAWAERLAATRPFADLPSLYKRADDLWQAASELDWLEATTAHPKIGDLETLKLRATEQAGVKGASEEVLRELARLNAEYYRKHGFIFIVCAQGKSALEMLEALRARMAGDTELELRRAAREQGLITRLRLEKLFT